MLTCNIVTIIVVCCFFSSSARFGYNKNVDDDDQRADPSFRRPGPACHQQKYDPPVRRKPGPAFLTPRHQRDTRAHSLMPHESQDPVSIVTSLSDPILNSYTDLTFYCTVSRCPYTTDEVDDLKAHIDEHTTDGDEVCDPSKTIFVETKDLKDETKNNTSDVTDLNKEDCSSSDKVDVPCEGVTDAAESPADGDKESVDSKENDCEKAKCKEQSDASADADEVIPAANTVEDQQSPNVEKVQDEPVDMTLPTFVCQHCDYVPKSGFDIGRHMNKSHPNIDRELDMFRCGYCPYTHKNRRGIRTHKRETHYQKGMIIENLYEANLTFGLTVSDPNRRWHPYVLLDDCLPTNFSKGRDMKKFVVSAIRPRPDYSYKNTRSHARRESDVSSINDLEMDDFHGRATEYDDNSMDCISIQSRDTPDLVSVDSLESTPIKEPQSAPHTEAVDIIERPVPQHISDPDEEEEQHRAALVAVETASTEELCLDRSRSPTMDANTEHDQVDESIEVGMPGDDMETASDTSSSPWAIDTSGCRLEEVEDSPSDTNESQHEGGDAGLEINE